MKTSALLLSLLSFAIPPHASGKKLAFCTPLEDLQAKVQNCEQNDYFAEAGIFCLEGFEKRLKASADALNLATELDGQNRALQQTHQALEKAKLTVAGLIVEGSFRVKEVVAYTKNISLPEDSDNPDAVGSDIKKFLQGSQCYKRAASVLESNMEEFDRHLKSLKKAQRALITAANSVKARSSDMGAKGAAAAASKGNGGQPIIPTGNEKQERSKVTGVEESLRKEKSQENKVSGQKLQQ